MTLSKNTARFYPLKSLGMLGDILLQVRKKADEFRSVISEDTEDDNHIVKFIDRKNFEFYFKVTYEDLSYVSGGNSSYKLIAACYPGDDDTHRHFSSETSQSDVIRVLESWISLLLSYNNAINEFDPEDEIQAGYEKEFKDEYKIVDEDAGRVPYDGQVIPIRFTINRCPASFRSNTIHRIRKRRFERLKTNRYWGRSFSGLKESKTIT
jgi:hypothetical protein